MKIEQAFLQSAIKRFKEYKSLSEKTFRQLNNEEMLYKPNEASNSISVIIKHIHGNMQSRWTNFLTEDGEKEWRKRDDEFEEESLTKQQLLYLWEEGWKTFFNSLESLTDDDLLHTVTIRSQPLLVIDAINRQLAHYSYHVGQLVYVGRMIKNNDWINLSIPKNSSSEFKEQIKNKNKS